MLYIVSKTMYRANVKNKAMTANVYGHNFAVNFRDQNWKVFAMFMKCISLFCSFVLFINFKMRIDFF